MLGKPADKPQQQVMKKKGNNGAKTKEITHIPKAQEGRRGQSVRQDTDFCTRLHQVPVRVGDEEDS